MEDKATVPIYYEAQLTKIDLKPEERLSLAEDACRKQPQEVDTCSDRMVMKNCRLLSLMRIQEHQSLSVRPL